MWGGDDNDIRQILGFEVKIPFASMAVTEVAHSDGKPASSILIAGALLLAAALYVAVTGAMSQVAVQDAAGGRGNVVEARLGKGTESLVEQLATHMSKLLGGESIGGFPGFEPPEDDEKYREKIRNQSYTSEEANYWVKEINNLLRQIIKKNPNMTLEEILQKMGKEQDAIGKFIEALQNTHVIASSLEEYGVSSEIVEVLESLMVALGVIPWQL